MIDPAEATTVFRMDRSALTQLDDLHRSHDGPPPPEVLQTVLLGGSSRRMPLAHAARLALHSRLAAEARLGTARRRATLPASGASTDPWLSRLSATLAHHRNAACSRDEPPDLSPLKPAFPP